MRFRGSLLFTLLAFVALAPSSALAQAELDGNFIDYLGVGTDGTMLNARDHSMRYSEAGADPFSCDVWYPDDQVSTFSIEGFGVGLGGFFSGTNGARTFFDINTIRATEVSGRHVTWGGEIGAGILGGGRLQIDHDYTFEVDDRVVVETITIRNPSPVTVRDIFYVTHGDPDQGDCGIGSSNDTVNDVVRQSPADGSSLVIAGTIPAATRRVFLGMGTFDALGRARVSPGIDDTDASVAWNVANDPNGARADRGMSIAFHPADLAAGASVTFHVFYVWGTSVEEVTNRFDSASCLIGAEGSSCRVGGTAGTCRARACCTGCWNGTACQAGSAVAACGAAGGACASCSDTNVCTDDACTAGACVRTNNTASCDDGAFCTSGDTCAAGACGAGARATCDDGLACTGNTCSEATDACATTVTEGCAVDGACRASGAAHPTDACLACVPAVSSTMWSYFASASCDSDGDSVPDVTERPGGVDRDTDMDGMPDHRDTDDDGDGLSTMTERPMSADVDTDGDMIPDYVDADDDGDGVPTTMERPAGASRDTDGDLVPDHRDPDDDGDGIPTSIEIAEEAAEGGDVDGDGTPAFLDTESDGDGALDVTEGRVDGDGDGTPDYLDPDTMPGDMDGDGVPDDVECEAMPCRDTDMDGMPDRNDTDDDGDGIPTRTELTDETTRGGDVDRDGTPAYRDLDSDGDGMPDRDEGTDDDDTDGVPDYLDPATTVPDMDGDGVPDDEECPAMPCRDTDMDGAPDLSDPDDDGDGIPTRIERADEGALGGDIDGDGVPAYLDTNSDGDMGLDRDEGVDDVDGDGVRDYLDPMSIPGPDAGVGGDAGASSGDAGPGGDAGRLDGGGMGTGDTGTRGDSGMGGGADAGMGSGVDSGAGSLTGGLAGGALCSAMPGQNSGSRTLGLFGLALALTVIARTRTNRARKHAGKAASR